MGAANHSAWLQNRIHNSSPTRGTHESHSSSSHPRTKTYLRGRNSWPSSKGCNPSSPTEPNPKPLPFKFFPDTQKTGHLETNSKPKTAKQEIHQTQEIQNGNTSHDHPVLLSRHVGYHSRLKRRLLTHPYSPGPSTVPFIPLQAHRFRLPSTSLRIINCAKGLHKSCESSSGFSPSRRRHSIRLHRRLADLGKIPSRMHRRHVLCHSDSREPRMDYQHRKIKSPTLSVGNLPWSSSRLSTGASLSYSRKNLNGHRSRRTLTSGSHSSRTSLASPSRPSSKSCRNPPSVQTLHETDSILHPPPLQTMSRPSVAPDSVFQRPSAVPTVVVLPIKSVNRETLCGQQAHDNHNNRRLELRLGSFLGDSLSGRPLVTSREVSSHQHSGTSGSPSSHRNLVQTSQGNENFNFVRQLHHSGVLESTGRDEISTSLSRNVGPSSVLSVPGHLPAGVSPSRGTERAGRRVIEGPLQQPRMDTQSTLGGPHFSVIRPSSCRSLCNSAQLQTSDLLFQTPGPSGLGDRCSSDQLGQHVCLRLPSMASTSESSSEIPPIQIRDDPDSALLAKTALVPAHHEPVGRPSLPFSRRSSPAVSGQRQDPPPGPTIPEANSLEIVNKRLLSEGLSQRSANLAASARRHSTTATYDSRLEKFFTWAENHSVDPLEAPVSSVCDFLVSLFDEGKQVSTIKNYRSAIAAVHSGFSDGSSVGSNHAILSLLKGMFNERPPRRRLAPSWSINEVLSSFTTDPYEPIHNAPLDALTRKTVFLVAAASARRRSEIHALSIRPGFIRFTPEGVHLLPNPSFLAKNQTESFTPDLIFLPSMSSTSSIREDRFVCPVRALKWYIEKTKAIRKSDALFLIPRSPYNPASKDTISRWLVETITPFTTPEDSPRAHDVRAHASSIAWFRGIPLSDIMRAASWKTPSTFVASYLTNVISPEARFAKSVLRGPASSTTAAQDLPPFSRC